MRTARRALVGHDANIPGRSVARRRYNPGVRFTTVFFDLDDTIYPASTGLWHAIKARMNTYMHERLGVEEGEIQSLREQYFATYGTTLRGLEAKHGVEPQEFLRYVHDLPLERFLSPDPIQREVILSLGTRNHVFTNADSAHARRVLSMLHLDDCFISIIDVNAVAPYCKPMPESFSIAMKLAAEAVPGRCVVIDDLPRTTRAARAHGMFSILYGADTPAGDAHAVLKDWRDLPRRLRKAPRDS